MDVDSSEVLGAVVALFQPSAKAPAARQRCLKAVSEHFGSPAAVASDDTWCGVTKEGFAGTISQSVEKCKVENVLIMPPRQRNRGEGAGGKAGPEQQTGRAHQDVACTPRMSQA